MVIGGSLKRKLFRDQAHALNAYYIRISVALLMSYYAHWCTYCTESPATAMSTIESACFVTLCSHLE